MSCVCLGDVSGLTQLHNVVYVVSGKSSIIKTFSADSLSSLGQDIYVEGMKDPLDIAVCRDDRQLYVADNDYCIWRVSADDHSDQEKWLPTESKVTLHVYTLSVMSRRLLMTSLQPLSLREYSTTDRQLLRVVQLPKYVNWLFHGVETTRGTFVIGHQGTSRIKDQYAVSELCRLSRAD